jgi:polar amino acid transport system ATP-binding protein
MSTLREKASGQVILDYRGVIKRFGALQVLNGISLTVYAGEVVCLIGPSGSGKSTLLRCTNGLERSTEARSTSKARRCRATSADCASCARAWAWCSRASSCFPHLTALQNVAEGPRTVLGMTQRDANDRAAALLAKVGLARKSRAIRRPCRAASSSGSPLPVRSPWSPT